ncbi:MAG: lysylphosphatidylglycerol synthase transmembrane domain-containing protein [Chloroflexota bacterium]
MRSRVRTGIRWAIGLILLGALISTLDLGALGARLGSLNFGLAAPAILGLVAVHLVAAASWRRLTWHLAGVRLDWRTTIRLYYAGQALGMVTPANLGADVYRVMATDDGPGRMRMARPVVIQRLMSIVALLLLGILGALLVPNMGLGPFVAALLVLAVGVSALTVVTTRGGPSLREHLGRGPVLRLVERLGLDGAADPGTGVAAGNVASAARDGLGLGLIFHGFSLLMGLALVAAVEPSVVARPMVVLGALAIARLSLTVPISPNGIGIQEGALAILFVQLGLPPDVALAAALLNRLALLLTAGLGAIALARGTRHEAAMPVRAALTEAAPGR